MLILLSLLASGAPVHHDDPAMQRVSNSLLHEVASQHSAVRHVVAVRAVYDDHESLASDIQSSVPGAVVEAASSGWVQVSLPGTSLHALARVPTTQSVRRPYRIRTKERTSEGLDTVYTGVPWHELGLAGDGVRVAVLDSGFAKYDKRIGKELPAEDKLHTYFLSDETFTDHGTSVAEIIHDFAPQAELALYSFDTDVEFMAACDQMLDNGEVLVNASIGYDNLWHADNTSPWSRKVNELHEAGVTWVAAAGNEADIYWVGTVTDDDADGWLEIEGFEGFPAWTADNYAEVRVRWDEPMGAAELDIDLLLDVDPATGEPTCGFGADTQDGDDNPLEWAWCDTDSEELTISLFDHSGIAAGTKVWLYNASGELPGEYLTLSESLTLPGDASGAISVGAWDVTTEAVAAYSSQGPTEDGRIKPDLVAPTQVTTRTGGRGNFNGTSAAAPHAAGIAALLLQATGGTYGPEDIRTWLVEHTRDGGEPGVDNEWGHGLIQLGDPPAGYEAHAVEYATPKGCGCSSGAPASSWAGLLALVVLGVRRRYRHSSPRR